MALIIPLNVEVSTHTVPLEVGTPVVQSTDYNDLLHKPLLNGTIIEGSHDSAYYGIDQTYIYNQEVASDEWIIQHNLNKYPSVTIVDSAGSRVVGSYRYVDSNTIICTFCGAFGGIAYLN